MTATADNAMANAYVPGKVHIDDADLELIKRRENVLGPAYRLMYDAPVHFQKGEGVYLFDSEGRAYLDAYNNVTSLGHCHPAVVDAISRQAATLATNTRYLHNTILEYAERLISTFPNALQHVMFTCSGSEANDLAYRIAKVYTGGSGVVVTGTAYHGITDAVAQFSPSLGLGVNLGAHVRTVPAPEVFRSRGLRAQSFATAVADAVSDLRRHGIKPAMLIVDSMFTSDGILSDPAGFLSPAAEVIRDAGGVFVADEVQPGFGRTGDTMWGFERHGVVPDLVTLGKPMGNGYPVAGVVARAEVIETFGRKARYFNTFGGNAVACAAALAVLSTIASEGLRENASAVGSYLKEKLSEIASRYEQLGDVRGAGLMLGIEIIKSASTLEPDAVETARILNGLRNHGVLISSCGSSHNVLKVRPPLVFTREHVDLFIGAFDEVMKERG